MQAMRSQILFQANIREIPKNSASKPRCDRSYKNESTKTKRKPIDELDI